MKSHDSRGKRGKTRLARVPVAEAFRQAPWAILSTRLALPSAPRVLLHQHLPDSPYTTPHSGSRSRSILDCLAIVGRWAILGTAAAAKEISGRADRRQQVVCLRMRRSAMLAPYPMFLLGPIEDDDPASSPGVDFRGHCGASGFYAVIRPVREARCPGGSSVRSMSACTSARRAQSGASSRDRALRCRLAIRANWVPMANLHKRFFLAGFFVLACCFSQKAGFATKRRTTV